MDLTKNTIALLLYYYVLNAHYYIFLIGFIVRFSRHRNLGKNNLNDPRPFTYKLKMLLQFIMMISTFIMAYDTDPEGNYTIYGIMFIFYGILWIVSIYLQYFEYERGLPHAWYTHQIFWVSGTILSLVILGFLSLKQDLFSELHDNINMKIKNMTVYIIQIITLFILSYLGIKHKREFPQHLRNYLPPQQAGIKKKVAEPLLPYGSMNNDNNPLTNSAKEVFRIPIIKATVASCSIDNGIVNFKIIILKDNHGHRKTKKTYNEFYELDQILENKYAKLIKKGILIKGELPKKEAYNFNKTQSLEQLKNQLKSYLEILTNQPNTFINDQKDDSAMKNNTFGLNNYLPKEYLTFLGFDLKFVDEVIELQDQKLNPQQQQEELSESLLYGRSLEIVIKRTDNLKEDIRKFLLKVLKREELYKIKIECIQKSSAGVSFDDAVASKMQDEGIIFTFQINNCFVFNKTLREVDKFCKDFVNEFKNPLIQMMGDLFSYCMGGSNNRVTTGSNNPSRMSDQIHPADLSQRYKILYQELEHASQQLEGYFKLILNDPDFHSDLIYKFFNCHQIFQLLPYVAIFREQNKSIKAANHFYQQQSSQQMQQADLPSDIIEEEKELEFMDDDSSIKNPFRNTTKPKTSMQKIMRPNRFKEDLKITNGSIQGFIGISVSCKVKKESIQIFDSHPTNIFTVEVTKKFFQNDEPILDKWNIKLSIAQVIQIATNLNIKYQNSDKIIPELLMSLIQFQNQVNQTFQNDQKINELETYLNQLLSVDTIIYSPALRSLLQFDKKFKKSSDKRSKNKHFRSGLLKSKSKEESSSDDKKSGGILDTDGQVEDYFNAEKNPFNRLGDESASNSFIVQGVMLRKNKKEMDYGDDEETGLRQNDDDSGIMGDAVPIANEYFKEDDDE